MLQNWQKALVEIHGCKITVDGFVGAETKSACWTVAKEDKGLLVSILQAELIVHGIRNTKIDASFGVGTEKDVQQFQKANGITGDSVAGPETFNKLLG